MNYEVGTFRNSSHKDADDGGGSIIVDQSIVDQWIVNVMPHYIQSNIQADRQIP